MSDPSTITPPDPMSLLMGGGVRSATFDNVGDRVSGEITAVETTQQTDPQTGAPKTWDDGSPRWQIVVTIQTGERIDDEDDGRRKLYIKGSMKYASTQKAVVDAVKAAGAKTLEVGGTLALAYTGDGERTNRAFNPPKLYQAAYKPPVAGVDLGDLLGG